MPSISTRGFIVRPTLDNTEPEAEPEFESLNVQACSDPYSFTRDEVYGIASRRNILSVPSDTVFSSSVEERIKDKMLEKIENYLERNQFHDLALLVTTYEKFKELHP